MQGRNEIGLMAVMKLLRVLLGAFCLFAISAMPVSAAKLAFVVGVDRYDNLEAHAQLKRAVNDARSVAGTFSALGYAVTQQQDLTRSQFNAAWQTFLDTVSPGDEIALYYSGHGIEIDGQNYLLPRNIPKVRYGRETQIKRESIALQEVLSDLRRKKPRVSLIILDACRDHPLVPPELRSTAASGGLANIHAPEGTFIMYSAGAGETALDRLPFNDPDPVNSVYTRNLLPLLRTPGLSLTEMAVRVRRAVYSLVSPVPHLQRPAYYDGVIGRYCVAGCSGASRPSAVATSPSRRRRFKPTVSARATTRPTQPASPSCTQIGRNVRRRIELGVGKVFCDKGARNRALVTKIANRYVVFSVNGGRRFACKQGELCAFNWPVKPLFRIEAKADAARGIKPWAQMLPR
jgi:Caspase domain